jgi:hypothetical protein
MKEYLEKLKITYQIVRKMKEGEDNNNRNKKDKESNSKKAIKVGSWVLYSTKELKGGEKANNLSRKFTNRYLGPYQVTNLDDRNHVTFQLTPTKTHTTRKSEVELFNGKYSNENNKFMPLFREIIGVGIPEERGEEKKERECKEREKKKFNVRTLMGRRIRIKWTNNRWYSATVIGYTADMKFNLVFLDERGNVEY